MAEEARSKRKEGRKRGEGRGWRAKLYPPTPKYPQWRVSFKDTATGKWVYRNVPLDDDPEDYFAAVEAALDEDALPPSKNSKLRPTLRMLADRHIQWLTDGDKDPDYIAGVQNILDVWVLKKDGGNFVDRWSPTQSRRWIKAARKAGLSPARVENLGVALSGLRKTAWRKGEDGLRWLKRSENPLEDVDYSRRTTEEGADRDYIPPSARPTTDQVESLIATAEDDCPWTWMPTQIRVGSYCGPRLGEQMAIRAVDVDLLGRRLRVRNSVQWGRPSRGTINGLKGIKTGRRRWVPYPGSLHPLLLCLCQNAFGLSADSKEEEVMQASLAHYDRHLRVLDEKGKRNPREARPYSPHETLLFVEATGLPPTKERYGEEWRKVRARSEWPTTIPWRNARHHCATWWPVVYHDEPRLREEAFARWLGHSVKTYNAHYRRSGDDADIIARDALDRM